MGIAAETGETLIRSVIVVVLSLLMAQIVRPTTGSNATKSSLAWWMLAGISVMPEWILGYGLVNFVCSTVRWPWLNEGVLVAMLSIKGMAINVFLMSISGAAPISPSAFQLRKISLQSVPMVQREVLLLPYRMRGQWFSLLLPACFTFLWTFQQFDLLTLMTTTRSWTVAVFDRVAAFGFSALEWKSLMWPVVVQIVLLVPIGYWFFCQWSEGIDDASKSVHSRRRVVTGWCTLSVAFAITLLPFALICWDSAPAMASVVSSKFLRSFPWSSMGASLLVAGTAALSAMLMSHFLMGCFTKRWSSLTKLRKSVHAGITLLSGGLLCVCLCGALVISILLLRLFQLPLLSGLYETTIPMIVGQTCFLLPRAVLLHLLMNHQRGNAAFHLTNVLSNQRDPHQRQSGRKLWWSMRGRAFWDQFALLTWWAYFDLTTADLLAPVAMAPLSSHLYNLMHYGHNATLSLLTFVSVLVPAVLFVLIRWLVPYLAVLWK
ncbi:hypothetical protein [Calycomorphotria hydatis]|uniref:Uncharacterized protein n=1 Tax=Calycomorphotria hydatis TaxID=2528027 RepID=A0A517T8W3_9PLAN|nr:hypothetical protein [Calycomorphotria hydatis]QDT64803.1 hypothetical protein V22_20460 [Calycomorphotria hydatis]